MIKPDHGLVGSGHNSGFVTPNVTDLVNLFSYSV